MNFKEIYINISKLKGLGKIIDSNYEIEVSPNNNESSVYIRYTNKFGPLDLYSNNIGPKGSILTSNGLLNGCPISNNDMIFLTKVIRDIKINLINKYE